MKEILKLHALFAGHYRPVILGLTRTINDLAQYIPQHRERIPHTGHFGYSRKVTGQRVQLPRAITFVATFGSLGIPPVVIGTGRALREVIRQGGERNLQRFFPDLHEDLTEAGHTLNWENLKFLIRQNKAWEPIREDVLFLEEYLGKRLGPSKPEHYIHRNLTSNIFHYWRKKKSRELKAEILQAAVVRRSLG